MRKLLLGLVFLGIAGCSQNQVIVENGADAYMNFCFMGERYPLAPGESKTINSVPYSNYAYTTIWSIPDSCDKGVGEEGLSGNLTFFDDYTKYKISYFSRVEFNKQDTTYTYYCGAVFTGNAQPINVTGP